MTNELLINGQAGQCRMVLFAIVFILTFYMQVKRCVYLLLITKYILKKL